MKKKVAYTFFTVVFVCHGLLYTGLTLASEHNDDMTYVIKAHLAAAKLSLGEIVLQSEKAGFTVLKAELDDINDFLFFENDTVAYKLLSFQNERVVKQFVIPDTGVIQDSKKFLNFSFYDDDYKKVILDKIVIPLSNAIEKVEKTYGGTAYKAELSDIEDIYLYRLSMIKGNEISTYIVDPLEGKTFKQLKTLEHMRDND